MNLDEFLDRLHGVRRQPSGNVARCPAHDDRDPSLSINEGDNGGIVLMCHAGCDTEDVLKALDLTFADINGKPVAPYVEAVYEYRNLDGSLAYTVERRNPKDFRCVPKLPPTDQRILYQLPAIEYARQHGLTVHCTEGEKDADALILRGLVATTNVCGADAWLDHYASFLDGTYVKVIADNDTKGRAHAREVYRSIRARNAVRGVELLVPPDGYGKDVTELLSAGYTLDRLVRLSPEEELTVNAASVPRKRVTWAWRNYIAAGKLGLIEGDPGDGKSVLTLDLAARWSKGEVMPDGTPNPFGGPVKVILVSAEDDIDDTLAPRLVAAGADLSNVEIWTGETDEPLSFADDLPKLTKLAKEKGAKVIVFDPLMAFLQEKTDSHNDASVRRALYPLRRLARATGAAVIAVRHLNKGGTGSKAIYRGGGSIAFTGAARSTFLVAPEDPTVENGPRVFACVKSNLARKPATLRYVIEARVSGDDEVPYVAWKGTSTRTANEALALPERFDSNAEEKASKQRARQYEIDALLDIVSNAPMAWADICEALKEDGFKPRTLERARADAGLRKVTGERGQSSTTWAHPTWLPPGVDKGPSEGDADTDSDGNERHSAISPLRHTPSSGPPGNGEMAEWEADANPALPAVDLIDGGQPPEVSGPHTRADLTDEDGEQRLAGLPMICEVCGGVDGVTRCASPYWTVRCLNHNPFLNGETSR